MLFEPRTTVRDENGVLWLIYRVNNYRRRKVITLAQNAQWKRWLRR